MNTDLDYIDYTMLFLIKNNTYYLLYFFKIYTLLLSPEKDNFILL